MTQWTGRSRGRTTEALVVLVSRARTGWQGYSIELNRVEVIKGAPNRIEDRDRQ